MIDETLKVREKIALLEQEVDALLTATREKFQYRMEQDKAIFAKDVVARQQVMKRALSQSLADARLRNLIAAPFIYLVFLPLLVLDGCVSLYQAICFRLWNIPRVTRKDFVIIDRHRLPYLNAIQKLNCMYCGYANGLIAYVAEVSSRTEQYWCPIKHALRLQQPHLHYYDFIDYGDYENLLGRIRELRTDLRKLPDAPEQNSKNST